MRRLLILCSILFAATGSLAGLRYAETTAPASLNPALVRDMPSLRAVELVYEGLVTPPEAGEVEPLLAESWKVADDGMSAEFTIRKGVDWHDGTKMTVDDVIFTIEACKDPRTITTLRTQFDLFDEIKKTSSNSVRVTFSRKVINPLLYFDFKILPAHLFPEGFISPETALQKPVGTGPYMFSRWAPSGDVNFTVNNDYWGRDKAKIDEVEVSPVPDENVQSELLRFTALDLLPKIRPKDIPGLEEISGVRLYPYSTLSYSYLGFNFRNPTLRDARVRRAIALGLDREAMLKAHFGNRGVVVSGPFPPASWAYNFEVEQWPFDPAKSRELLNLADLTDFDDDGFRDFKQEPLTLKLVSLAQKEVQKAVALDVQQQLKTQGLKVDLHFLDSNAWRKTVFEDKDYDLLLSEWTFDNSVNVYSLFHSTQTGPGQNNFGSYFNPEADRLLENAREANETELVRATYGELHRLLHNDLPYVFLWSLNRYAAVNSRINNVRLHPFYFFTYVAEWREK